MDHFVSQHPILVQLRDSRLEPNGDRDESTISRVRYSVMNPRASTGVDHQSEVRHWKSAIIGADRRSRTIDPPQQVIAGFRVANELHGHHGSTGIERHLI